MTDPTVYTEGPTESHLPQSANHSLRANHLLTSEALIALDYIAPPEKLAPYVTTFFLMRCEEPQIIDVLPAGLGIVIVFLNGDGEILIRDGAAYKSQRTNILTPLSAAAPITVNGPWHSFGASLSPLGWAAVTGRLSAAEHGNRLLDAGAMLGPQFTDLGEDMAARWNAGESTPADMAEALGDAIAARLKKVPAAHQKLIATVAGWLNEELSPRVDRLHEMVLYSPRQLQRLVDQYFGLPPKQLARKYRALRAAGMLADPRITDAQVTLIAEQFYDQSHMIREISLFAGRTPKRIGGGENPMLTALLDLRNFREIKPTLPQSPPNGRCARNTFD